MSLFSDEIRIKSNMEYMSGKKREKRFLTEETTKNTTKNKDMKLWL